jgi:multicomponent Na+:H+ antiporter subunit F
VSSLAVTLCTVLLSVAAVLSVARVVRRGTVADRTIGLDLAVIVLAAGVVTGAAAVGRTVFLSVVTVVALLAFVATATIARFVEPGGADPEDPS